MRDEDYLMALKKFFCSFKRSIYKIKLKNYNLSITTGDYNVDRME